MRHFILFASFASALPLLLAKDDPGSGGSTPPLSLEDRLTAAEQARDKAATDLKTANDQLANLTSLTAERDTLKSQFGELTKTADKLKTDLKAAQDQVTTLTTERDSLSGKLKTSAENVTRLESLCGVKGIDSSKAVPAAPGSTGSSTHVYDQWLAATGGEKTRLFNAHRPEIRAEAGRRAAAAGRN